MCILFVAVRPGSSATDYRVSCRPAPTHLRPIDYPTKQSAVVFMAVPRLTLFPVPQRDYVRGFMSGVLRG